MARKRRNQHIHGAPLLHENHKRPVTRREFLAQGFISGGAFVMAPTVLSLLSSKAFGADAATCGLSINPTVNPIPFICFDLGGGANMVGSNVLAGGPGGQLDFISTAGYNKLGLPGDMIPSVADTTNGLSDHVYTEMGLAFHTDSAFLRGIVSKTSSTTRQNINGAVIPARSDNDTSNNPHNPMYGIAKAGIAKAGAYGKLVTLIGTQNSDSGGRSMSPADMIDLTIRPTKVDRPSDATGLVDTGQLGTLMPNTKEAGAVMSAIEEISWSRIGKSGNPDALDATTVITKDGKTLQDLVDCGYIKTTDTVTRFGDISAFDPAQDSNIVITGDNTTTATFTNAGSNLSDMLPTSGTPFDSSMPIFTDNEFGKGTFQKTSSVMKLVGNGLAGAGTIQLGGYDYHTSDRSTGEKKDFEAGQAIGAVLEYAARVGNPMMVYVFTDGSLASNGSTDGSADGRGKGVWSGDNSSTSASFFLVYNPNGKPTAIKNQLGYFRDNGSVETTATTPGANNVNLLVQMLVLNYMALSGDQNNFSTLFPNHGLGTNLDQYIALQQLT